MIFLDREKSRNALLKIETLIVYYSERGRNFGQDTYSRRV